MAAFINTNIASLNSQRNLNASQSSLTTSLQRLSSGLRINSAKDDSAGMAIADRMTSQIRGMNQAVRNANDGISIAQTAEGALAEVGNNLQRIRELAVQSANASNSTSDRESLNTEAQQLKAEIDRVAGTTSFNNVKLLNGSFTSQDFQVGANAGEVITIGAIADARSTNLGKTTTASVDGVAATGFANAVTGGAGVLTIQDGSGAAVEILDKGLAIAGSAAERTAQVKEAINAKSSQTGVSATIDTTTGNLKLSSSHAITIAGSATSDDVGLGDGLTTVTASVTGKTAATASTNGFAGLDISSAGGAAMAIQYMDNALTSLNTARSNLGAYQNRFSSAISSLQASSENLSASRSRIQDTDFASETANMTRGQILQQAGTAMLAQANSLPNGVLALLRG